MSVDSGTPPTRADREEMLIEATFRYWWRRRRFIAVTMFGFILVFATVLMLIPKAYRAQASIIIMPPRFMPEIRTEPLTVLSAQSLLQTNELYQQVKLNLRRYRNILIRLAGANEISTEVLTRLSHMSASEIAAGGAGASPEEAEAIAELDPTEILGIFQFSDEELAELSIDQLENILTSTETIEKRTAADIVHSPVLQLFAVADTGNKAQVLVNLWAQLFEDKYESLTRGQTRKVYESLEKQQDAGQEELEDIQRIIVEFSLKNNLELIQRQITEHADSFTSINEMLITKNYEYTTLEAKVNSLNQLLESLEDKDFNWIGNLRIADITTETDHQKYTSADTGASSSDSAVVQRRRRETFISREELLEAYEAAARYNVMEPVEVLQAELKQVQEEYLKKKSEYRWNIVEAEVARKTLVELSDAVEQTSQAIPLHTALPDEVLGEMLAAGRSGDAARVANIHLNKEQLNPLWETLVKQRSEVSRSLHEAEATVSELEADLPGLEAELRQLNMRIFQARQGETLVSQRVQRADKINQRLFDDYTQMRENAFELGWEKTMLQDEIQSLENAMVRLQAKIEELRVSYEAASAQHEILKLRKQAVLQRAELLTEKLQESMVAVREEVSDVSLASKAVAPTRHFFPPRTILLLVLSLLTGGILLGGLSRKRYRELAGQ